VPEYTIYGKFPNSIVLAPVEVASFRWCSNPRINSTKFINMYLPPSHHLLLFKASIAITKDSCHKIVYLFVTSICFLHISLLAGKDLLQMHMFGQMPCRKDFQFQKDITIWQMLGILTVRNFWFHIVV
jgi:hypothetical protein